MTRKDGTKMGKRKLQENRCGSSYKGFFSSQPCPKIHRQPQDAGFAVCGQGCRGSVKEAGDLKAPLKLKSLDSV